MFVDSTTQQKLPCVHQGDNYWRLQRNMEMWLCLCLRASWAARFTNYSCCGVVLSLRGERWWGAGGGCLSKELLSLFFSTVSLPSCVEKRKRASASEWHRWQHHLHKAGETSFSSLLAASRLSQEKRLTAIHLVWNRWAGRGKLRTKILSIKRWTHELGTNISEGAVRDEIFIQAKVLNGASVVFIWRNKYEYDLHIEE